MKFTYPQKYLVAFVFVATGAGGYEVKKYRHNIKDNIRYVAKFCRDMKTKFPAAEYINFYDKASNLFKERIHLQ